MCKEFKKKESSDAEWPMQIISSLQQAKHRSAKKNYCLFLNGLKSRKKTKREDSNEYLPPSAFMLQSKPPQGQHMHSNNNIIFPEVDLPILNLDGAQLRKIEKMILICCQRVYMP